MKIGEDYLNILPASAIAGDVNSALEASPRIVVTAAPGAGKSTLLPLTVLEWLDAAGIGGKILMLEPRRIAARQIAERMSFMIGEPVGKTVGYRVRFESKVSAATRIEVLTEGILTRMITEDPTLDGVSVLIFDEFHERSLASDLALALSRETQDLVRPDLRVVIMSATIDADSICSALGAPLVQSEGRFFPVEILHCPEPDLADLSAEVARTVLQAHREKDGDILAFLPGEAEIRRCAELLDGHLGATRVMPLYGLLSFDEQHRAIAPSRPGERKVVLATPIAETSLTIEGVRVVVDSGYCRKMLFDPQSGLSRLETVRISMDMAQQRSGRAGRVAAGCCYRMWSLATESRMSAMRVPEILEADLAPMLLDIAAWGEGSVESLRWLTPPPVAMVSQARQVLGMLDAFDSDGRLTPVGRRMASLPCHPRIAHMLLSARDAAQRSLAADIAALLDDRDPLAGKTDDSDMGLRVRELRRTRAQHAGGRSWSRTIKAAEQYLSLASRACGQKDTVDDGPADSFEVGALLAAAYPERVARAASDGLGRFMLAGGGQAFLEKEDALASCEWIAVALLNARKDGPGRIFLASPLDPADLSALRERDNICWDTRKGAVLAQRERGIGCLVVETRPLSNVPRERLAQVIAEAARKEGLTMLDFSDSVQNLQQRVAVVSAWHPELDLPDLSTEAVLACAPEWLPMYVGTATSVQELRKIDLCAALWGMLDYAQQQAVERIAPSHIEVPTGSRIRVEYRVGADAPVLRVRLQECFGLVETPCVDDGRRPVLMELLSPGYKPVQLTKDLRSFWEGTYFEVRKELRRRYPKHSWPDNPLEAEAVRGVRRK